MWEREVHLKTFVFQSSGLAVWTDGWLSITWSWASTRMPSKIHLWQPVMPRGRTEVTSTALLVSYNTWEERSILRRLIFLCRRYLNTNLDVPNSSPVHTPKALLWLALLLLTWVGWPETRRRGWLKCKLYSFGMDAGQCPVLAAGPPVPSRNSFVSEKQVQWGKKS